MKEDTKVIVYGLGKTGTQLAENILRSLSCVVSLYDKNLGYAQGIALDLVQASVMENSRAELQVIQDSSNHTIARNSVLIVCEGVDETLDENWLQFAQHAQLIVFATADLRAMQAGKASALKKEKIFSIRGFANANVLVSCAAQVLNVHSTNIKAMVFGSSEFDWKSSPEYLRVGGVPIDEIRPGAYQEAMEKASSFLKERELKVWGEHYRYAAACKELICLLFSGSPVLIPVTTVDGTIPAIVDICGVVQYCPELIKG